jgi:hypothetical protein
MLAGRPRKNDGHYPEMIYRYSEYRALQLVIAMAMKRELKNVSVISRTRILDTIETSAEYRHIIHGICMPNPGMWHPKTQTILRYKDRRIWNVMGVIMRDLGFYKYSNHAWCQQPVEPTIVPVRYEI